MALRKATSQGVLIDIDLKNKCDNKDDRSSSSVDTSPKNDQGSSSNASGSNSKSESSRTGTTEDEPNMIKEELARHETTNVFRLRIVVIVILVAVAAAVSYIIYDITHKAEITAFETEFEGNAELIIASLNGKYKDMSVASLLCD
jgi:cobalamin biosynthesis Mg chelatase CobN